MENIAHVTREPTPEFAPSIVPQSSTAPAAGVYSHNDISALLESCGGMSI